MQIQEADTDVITRAVLPTTHPPRSPGKIEILALRASLRLPLFVKGDSEFSESDGLRAKYKRCGNRSAAIDSLLHFETGQLVETVKNGDGETGRKRSDREIERSQQHWAKLAAAAAKRRARRLKNKESV